MILRKYDHITRWARAPSGSRLVCAAVFCLVLVAGIVSAQDHSKARQEAVEAFRRACEEIPAGASPRVSVLPDLVTWMLTVGPEEAGQALDFAYKTIEANPQELSDKEPDGAESNYSKEALVYLELGEIAALFDRDRAKTCLLRAQESNKRLSATDELVAACVDTCLLALSGETERAMEQALAFCNKTATVQFRNKKLFCGEALAHVLVFFEPELAFRLAGHFSPLMQGRVLAKTVERLALLEPERTVDFCLQSLGTLAELQQASPVPLEVAWCIEPIGEKDYRLLEGALKTLEPGVVRDGVRGAYWEGLAEEDLEAALRRLPSEGPQEKDAAIYRTVLKHALQQDPYFLIRAKTGSAAPGWLRRYAGRDEYIAAATKLVERGDLESALSCILCIRGGGEWPDALVTAARAAAEKTPENAVALLDSAFRIPLTLFDVQDRETLSPLRSILATMMSLDPEKGVQGYEVVLEETAKQTRRILREGDAEQFLRCWAAYGKILSMYAETHPEKAYEALHKVPQALAIRGARAARDTISSIVDNSSLPYRLAWVDPEFASAFVRDADDRAQTYWEARLAVCKAYHSFKTGRADVSEVEKHLEGVSGPWLPSHVGVFDALATVFREERERTIELVHAISNSEKRDVCFMWLALRCAASVDEMVSLTRLIELRTCRLWAWLYWGQRRAQDVPEWRFLQKRGLGV